MFKFALKNMAVKKVQIVLIVLSIVISAGVGVLAYNVAGQVSDGIAGNAAYYSAIVGPAGSSTQLAMNTMYFTDTPLGTIPYEVVDQLKGDTRVREAIPFAMADNYNGYNVVGTTPAYLATKTVADGAMFDEDGEMQIVLGSTVARRNGLHVGDEIHTSHSVGEEHHEGMTVVGILEETHSKFDEVVFTQIRTIWEVHEHEEGHEEEHEGGHEEEHDHEDMNGMVCAILVKATNPATAMQIVNEYNSIFTDSDGDAFSLQAIEPMETVRGVLDEADSTKYIVFVLCAIIIVMNIMIICIITMLNMYHSAKEIALMRLIGIGMRKINLLYIIQNGLIGLVSTILAFAMSRVCLLFMGDYVASMGVVLDVGRVYPLEFIILFSIFVISVLPTVVCTFSMARKDSISD